ncbi:MAG TPA: GAF domain-containing protein [Chitinophagaceae bacterium]|jgi:GAF domain-containing protein|nr:GAF domain-containing protein [Chitinophagaceae bacterium]
MIEDLYTQTYQQALAMHESGGTWEDILYYIAGAAETAAGLGTAVSILLLDNDGLLRNAASPQLPDDYLRAIDGLRPNADVGTCAAAAATGCVVLTPSFYADNKWAELRHLPLALGYLGAWSMPIKTGDNKVIGTFGTYFRQHREPSDAEVKGTELLVAAVAIVLAPPELETQMESLSA